MRDKANQKWHMASAPAMPLVQPRQEEVDSEYSPRDSVWKRYFCNGQKGPTSPSSQKQAKVFGLHERSADVEKPVQVAEVKLRSPLQEENHGVALDDCAQSQLLQADTLNTPVDAKAEEVSLRTPLSQQSRVEVRPESAAAVPSRPPAQERAKQQSQAPLQNTERLAACAENVSEEELLELSALTRPPPVRGIVESALMLLGFRDASWASARAAFEDPERFKEKLRSFNASKISRLQYQKLRRSLAATKGLEQSRNKCGSLEEWCCAVADVLSSRYGEAALAEAAASKRLAASNSGVSGTSGAPSKPQELEAWLQPPMKRMKTLVLWALVALVAVAVPAEGLAAPMQKVIGALEKMQATSEEEMQEEKIQFTKFDQFCSATLDVKKKAIQQTRDTLESITSEISRLDSEAEKMSKEIAQHEAAIKNSQEQKSNATELRKAEEENFNATRLDLQESSVAIQKALQQLKKENYDRPQSTSASFVQSSRGLGGLGEFERSETVAKALALAAAFRNKPVPPKADAYEFQSGSIIEVLEDLKDQFKKQISEVESSETKKKNSHELLLSSLDSEIKVNKKATEKKSGFKDSALGRKAEAEAKKSDVMADLEADEKYRNDLSVECKVKGNDFAERQRVPNAAVENIVKMLKEKLEKLQTEDVDDSKQKVENLKAEIERLQSSLVQRSEENEELADDMTKMDKSIQEATAMRNEEKASNLNSLKEATEGKEALSAAMDVLQSFYQSLALVQQSVKSVKRRQQVEGKEIKPEFSAGGYSGQSGQNSIIALLQKVAADFAKEASDLKAAEDAAASEFKQFADARKKREEEIKSLQNAYKILSAYEYVLRPDLGDLVVTPDIYSMTPNELRHVRDLKVHRPRVGEVTFHGEIDLIAYPDILEDLPNLVRLDPGEVVLYPDSLRKPFEGEGLNRPATITLFGCLPPQLADFDEESKARYRHRIAEMTEQKGARFLDYDCDKGLWQFCVDHF
eukprot:s2656_g7.t2